jgi:hypothetical protein
VGGIGLVASLRLGGNLDAAMQGAAALHASQTADMMHDALRGDVLLGLKASAEGDIVAVTEAADLVQSHSAEFKASIDENSDLMLSEEISQKTVGVYLLDATTGIELAAPLTIDVAISM